MNTLLAIYRYFQSRRNKKALIFELFEIEKERGLRLNWRTLIRQVSFIWVGFAYGMYPLVILGIIDVISFPVGIVLGMIRELNIQRKDDNKFKITYDRKKHD